MRWADGIAAALQVADHATMPTSGVYAVAQLPQAYAADPEAFLELSAEGRRLSAQARAAWGQLDDSVRAALLLCCACVDGFVADDWLGCTSLHQEPRGAARGGRRAHLADSPPPALRALSALRASGWLSATRDEQRLFVPEPLRHVARRSLAGADERRAADRSHAAIYLSAAEQNNATWLLRERANLEAVIDRFVDADPALHLRAVAALLPVLRFHAAPDALRNLLMSALELSRHAPSLAPELRLHTAVRLIDRGAFDDAMRWLDPSRGTATTRANAALSLGHVRIWLEDYVAAERAFADADAMRQASDHKTRAAIVMQRAFLSMDRGDADAEAIIDAALRCVERVGYERGITIGLYLHGRHHLNSGQPDKALRWLARSRRRAIEQGDERAAYLTDAFTARALRKTGDVARARSTAESARVWAAADVSDSLELLTLIELVDCGDERDHDSRLEHLCQVIQIPRLRREGLVRLKGARVMLVSDGASWARVGGAHIDLRRHRAPRRILCRLCERALERADAPVTVDELFEAGWPGETIRRPSRKKRVHTAIWTLRRLGLEDVVQTRDGGYGLSVPVRYV